MEIKCINSFFQIFIEKWEEVSDSPKPAPKVFDDDENIKTGFLVNLLLEDDFKESILKKQQSWNETVLKGKRC